MLARASARAFFSIGLACLPAITLAEQPTVSINPRARLRSNSPRPDIRVDIKLTVIPVTVTDPVGAAYAGLTREDFRLFEDGVEQEVRYLSSDDSPVSVGVVFDASQSMEGKIDQSRAAVSRFFNTTNRGDEFFLVEFNNAPRMLCDFTSDTEKIEKTLVNIQPKSWTALFDAVYLGVRKMKPAKNPRKALLILSDGGDNYSRYTQSEMKALVREADVSIYSIALVGSGLLRRHVGMLRGLSDQTGGHVYEVEKMGDLAEAVAKASAAIRNQYLLAYVSSNTNNDGMYRKIQVRVNPRPDAPRLRASWRTGYYAPGEQ
jgi:Ca-activated chloride channel family protein